MKLLSKGLRYGGAKVQLEEPYGPDKIELHESPNDSFHTCAGPQPRENTTIWGLVRDRGAIDIIKPDKSRSGHQLVIGER